MKNKGSFITTIVVIALAFALIFGANQFMETQRESLGVSSEYASVFPEGTEFEDTELELDSSLQDKIANTVKVTDGSQDLGYVFDMIGNGYGGEFTYRIGVGLDGVVKGFEVLQHGETDGFGAAFTESEFVDGVVGTNLSTGNVSAGEGNKENGEIIAISGATITTNAVTSSFVDVVNAVSTVSDNVEAIVQEMDYYTEKWQELFANDLSIFTFEEFVDEDFYKEGIKRIIRVKNQEGQVDSYILFATASGYAGNIDYLVRVTPEYRVYNIAFGAHAETPNLGAYIEDPVYKDTLKGVNLDKNLLTKAIKLRTEPTQEKDILLIAGATVTSDAMKVSLDGVIEDLVRFDKVRDDDSKYEALNLEDLQGAEEAPGYAHTDLFEAVTESQPIEEGKNDTVVQVSQAISDGENIGKIYDINVEGFAGNIEYGVLVSNEGIIEDFVIYNHSETPDYGAVIEEDSFKDGIVGINFNETPDFPNDVLSISGATFTTDGMSIGMSGLVESYNATKDIN